MPKQIFQRPAPVRRQNLNKGGKPGGLPDFGRKPPAPPKSDRPAADKARDDSKK